MICKHKIMEGLSRSAWRDAPGFHFGIRINSFSTLSTSFQKYKSSKFEVANYNGKLVLYPNGNKSKDVEDHISVYLKCSNLKEKILVSFTLLVLDQDRCKFLSVQDVSYFDEINSQSGFDKFLPLKLFKDPSNGYLSDDSCLFGADIFLKNDAPEVLQYLSMMKSKPAPFKFSWKLEKISKLKKKLYCSGRFTTWGHDWKLQLYPSENISIFLYLADPETVGNQVLVEYMIRIVDQVNHNNEERKQTKCFSAQNTCWGFPDFLPVSELKVPTGLSVNDMIIVEAEVCVLGSAKSRV